MNGFLTAITSFARWCTDKILIPVFGKEYWGQYYGIFLFVLFLLLVAAIVVLSIILKKTIIRYKSKVSFLRKELNDASNECQKKNNMITELREKLLSKETKVQKKKKR